MDVISQITYLLDGYKLAKIDIIDNNDSESRFTEFYRMIKNGELKSDEEAMQHFYPEPDKQDQNYRKFKSLYKDRLINTVLFLDTNHKSASEHQNATAEAQKIWAATCVLFNRLAFTAAVEISEKLLRQCLHYEFTELVVQITEKLKHWYGTMVGDKNKYQYFRDLHFEYVDYYMAELKAKDLYQSIRMPYIKSAAYNKEMYAVAEDAIKELETLYPKCATYMFMSFWYYIRIAKYQTVFDNKNIIKVCEEGVAHFEGKKYEARAPIALLLNQKLIAQIQLRQYEAGRITAAEVSKRQTEGTHNWYKSLEQRMMLAFHTKEYAEAQRVYQVATEHNGFKFLKSGNLEIWQLYEAYLVFVIKLGKMPNVTLAQSNFKNFKLSRFLNDVNQFSGDKKGMNVPTLIIQYVLQITEKNRDQLVDRIEAIEQYVKRHVKPDDAMYRSQNFLKLLLELFRVNYSKKLIAAKAKVLLKEIENGPIELMEQGDRIEIMPFEHLWEEMQPLLKP